MKFKGLTKLAMSGVALAAVAATLGTSTYAWYVTNSTATATNIEASTKRSDGSNLLVSKDGSNFQSKIVFASTDNNYAVNGEFQPVTVDSSTFTGELVTATLASDGTYSTAASSAYLHFYLWVKSSSDVTVQPTLSAVNNTAASLPAQKAYYGVGSAAITAGSTFTVDAMQAFRTSLTITAESGTSVTATSAVSYSTANTTVYDTLAIAKQDDFQTQYSPAGTVTAVTAGSVNYVDASGASQSYTATGAHAYYTAVMAAKPYSEEDKVTVSTGTSNKIATFAATADVAYRLDFFVWLEGSDTFCFDACGGQNFTFGLEFSKA